MKTVFFNNHNFFTVKITY